MTKTPCWLAVMYQADSRTVRSSFVSRLFVTPPLLLCPHLSKVIGTKVMVNL